MDWKLNSIIFQLINHRYGPLEIDLFAMKLISQCPLYFSRRLHGNRCIPSVLEWTESIYQPTMEPGSSSGSITTITHSPSSTCLEGTTMVPNTSGDVNRLPKVDATRDGDNIQFSSNFHHAQTSLMKNIETSQ